MRILRHVSVFSTIAVLALLGVASEGPSASSWGLKVGEVDLAKPLVKPVSMLKILVLPELVDGRRIVTEGLLYTGEQESYLFLFTEDWKRFRLSNAVMLRFNIRQPAPDNWGRRLHGRRVEVEGVLRSPEKMPFVGTGGGLLDGITRVFEIKDGISAVEPIAGTKNENTKK